MNTPKYEKLGDADDRFITRELVSSNDELRKSIGDYAVKNSPGASVHSKMLMRHGVTFDDTAPLGLSVVDTISNREFALVRYAELDGKLDESKDYEEQASVRFILAEVKDNKIVGTPEGAAVAMGLPGDFSLPPSSYSRATNPYTPDFWIEIKLREAISEQQKAQPQPWLNGQPAPDFRAVLSMHTKHEQALNEYLDAQKASIDTQKAELAEFDANTDPVSLSKEDRLTSWATRTKLADKIKSQELEVLYAIVTPEKFEVNGEGKAVLVQEVDLNNRFAKTTASTTIPLGDLNNRYNIGKVSAGHIEDSPSIAAGDTILSSIRVRTSGDDTADTNIYAIKDEGGQSWIRAERVTMDGFISLDEQSLKSIGIDSSKLIVGGDTPSDKVMAQISPAALRETIAKKQILEHNLWKKVEGFGGEPIREHKASAWAFPRYNDGGEGDRSVLEMRALREANARKTDSRTTVVDLSQQQVERLEEFGIIREAQIPKSKGYEYIGGASGYIITDHLHNSVQIIGQALIHTDRNSGIGEKKVEATGFDIAIRSDRIGIQYAVRGSSPGTIEAKYFDAAYEEAHGDGWDLAGAIMRADFNGQSADDSDETRYTGKNIVEALASSEDMQNYDDPKMYNDFGRGIKHDSLVKLDRATALKNGYDMKMEVVDHIEPTRPKMARP